MRPWYVIPIVVLLWMLGRCMGLAWIDTNSWMYSLVPAMVVLWYLLKWKSMYDCCKNCCEKVGCFGWPGPHSSWKCKIACLHPAFVAACCWIETKEVGCKEDAPGGSG